MQKRREDFSEIVFCPDLGGNVIKYFTGEASIEPAKKDIVRMRESGTITEIVFMMVASSVQTIRVISPQFRLTSLSQLNKLREIMMLIFDDEDRTETATRQLFSLYIQTDGQIRQEGFRNKCRDFAEKIGTNIE